MAEKHEQWMPLYIADYLGDTMHLTAEQHGAYLLLLMAAWKRGGHVPDDDDQLAIITRMGTRWQTHASAIVRAFFTQRDGMLWSQRIEAELVKAKTHTAKKSAAGKAGAAAKWQKDGTGNGTRIANALPEQCHSDAPSPSPITSSLRSDVESASPQRGSRLPTDWVLPDDWAAWAKADRPDLDPAETAKRFADYWHGVAGAKGRKADWQATWRNWVRNEKARPGGSVRRMPVRENFDAVNYGVGVQDL